MINICSHYSITEVLKLGDKDDKFPQTFINIWKVREYTNDRRQKCVDKSDNGYKCLKMSTQGYN